MKFYFSIIIAFCTIHCNEVLSQNSTDTALSNATLSNCVQYAFKHQPLIRQSLIDEDITNKTIQSKLADWYPQLNFNYNYQNYFKLPVFYFAGVYVRTGTYNTSTLGLSLTQNIFTRDLLFANKTSTDVNKQMKQSVIANKISIAVGVSKAFYDVLLTQKQISVLNEDIIRLDKSLQDAYHQYQSGIVDKTDYKRATISLNNAKAERQQIEEALHAKNVYLKQLMGYPENNNLRLNFDTTLMEQEALLDTSIAINIQNRIEYQTLLTQQKLQKATIQYNKWSYLPTVSALGNYNYSYLSNNFGKLYAQSFANSFLGLQVSLPIFQGNKRVFQIKQSQLQLERIDWDMIALKNKVNTEYAQAMAAYKGNLANYAALKDNVALANDVYTTIRLQYNSGIKTYLDVIIAESDLRTAQLNFYTALYQLLESKIDVEKALGNIPY